MRVKELFERVPPGFAVALRPQVRNDLFATHASVPRRREQRQERQATALVRHAAEALAGQIQPAKGLESVHRVRQSKL